MTNKYSVALFLYTRNRSYSKLKTLAQAIHDGLTAMAATYATPNPPLTTLAAQIAALDAAIAAWNDGAGSDFNLATLRAAAADVRETLRELGDYVMNTTPNDTVSWIGAGFEVKAIPSPVGMLQAVRDLHAVTSPKIQLAWLRLKWLRPLGSERAKGVKYKVMRSATNDVTTAVQVAISSRSFFDYAPPSPDAMYYWIIPINSDGTDGVVSDVCFASPKRA